MPAARAAPTALARSSSVCFPTETALRAAESPDDFPWSAWRAWIGFSIRATVSAIKPLRVAKCLGAAPFGAIPASDACRLRSRVQSTSEPGNGAPRGITALSRVPVTERDCRAVYQAPHRSRQSCFAPVGSWLVVGVGHRCRHRSWADCLEIPTSRAMSAHEVPD